MTVCTLTRKHTNMCSHTYVHVLTHIRSRPLASHCILTRPPGTGLALGRAVVAFLRKSTWQRVRVEGLRNKPEYNGRLARVQVQLEGGRFCVVLERQEFDSGTECARISLRKDKVLSLKGENLVPVSDDAKCAPLQPIDLITGPSRILTGLKRASCFQVLGRGPLDDGCQYPICPKGL